MTFLFGFLVIAGILTGLRIAVDVKQHPPHMKIMKVTWPVTGLYMPVFGWWVWCRLGKKAQHAHPMQGSSGQQAEHAAHGDHRTQGELAVQGSEQQAGSHHNHQQHEHSHHDHHQHQAGSSVSWRSACVSATHCGAGCVIGDILAAPIAGATHFQVGGSAFLGHTLLSLLAAFLIGILFQYLPIREMGESSPKQAMIKAVKADTFSLLCFQAGMFIFLLIARGGDLHQPVEAASWHFWGLMIIAMFVGYLVSVPVNYRLIKAGIKHGM